jgi:hypothetical protein
MRIDLTSGHTAFESGYNMIVIDDRDCLTAGRCLYIMRCSSPKNCAWRREDDNQKPPHPEGHGGKSWEEPESVRHGFRQSAQEAERRSRP